MNSKETGPSASCPSLCSHTAWGTRADIGDRKLEFLSAQGKDATHIHVTPELEQEYRVFGESVRPERVSGLVPVWDATEVKLSCDYGPMK